MQVLVRWKSKLHLGTFWVLEASGKRWRTQTFMLRGRALLRMLRKSTTNVQRKYDLAQLEKRAVPSRTCSRLPDDVASTVSVRDGLRDGNHSFDLTFREGRRAIMVTICAVA